MVDKRKQLEKLACLPWYHVSITSNRSCEYLTLEWMQIVFFHDKDKSKMLMGL